ncbi:hypothetical protein [uncultured Aquimarina sp.]|uniref:hypothetical protein n=1 Tax=uncultured Aquimarina sp. TaxID=575652 RepID=UPI00260B0F15|nr:hypothetical protein [uncultured Aquimarina sp.]
MKYIISLIILCWYSNCKAQEVLFNDEEPDNSDLVIISETIKSDWNLITFTQKFDNEKVEVFVDQNSVYKGSVSTDPRFGSARGVILDRKCDSILVVINNEKIQLKNSNEYRFIYIIKNDKKYTVEFRKKPYVFY